MENKDIIILFLIISISYLIYGNNKNKNKIQNIQENLSNDIPELVYKSISPIKSNLSISGKLFKKL